MAGMLILKHGRMATYQAGTTTPQGRETCAHNRLLWQVMCDLQKRQITRLDLGRADLSPGLRRFKLGAGAEVETLGGSFLFHHWFRSGLPKQKVEAIAENTVANI
ncbi:MAG: GNAT family N-acetyltransferase [Pseudomonadota bacterium]